MISKRRIVIVGATSAIAVHCARIWAKESPLEVILVGRSQEKLARHAADLKVRTPNTTITSITGDFLDPTEIQRMVNQIVSNDIVNIVLIAHGSLPDQGASSLNLKLCREALEVNGLSPVMFAEAFANHMQKANSGVLALIGSVAGDRGRKSNYIYGAAKGLVERYVQGLQHRLANTKVKVVLIKPGPTDTPMTAHLKGSGLKLAAVAHVASDIIHGIESGCKVIYTPKRWMAMMLIIRHLPSYIFNRLKI